MVWSGVTKFVRGIAMENQRPVEVPGLGIFGPITNRFDKLYNPMDKSLSKRKSTNHADLIRPMRFLVNEDFLHSTDQ